MRLIALDEAVDKMRWHEQAGLTSIFFICLHHPAGEEAARASLPLIFLASLHLNCIFNYLNNDIIYI